MHKSNEASLIFWMVLAIVAFFAVNASISFSGSLVNSAARIFAHVADR
jgi:hypothetical protein